MKYPRIPDMVYNPNFRAHLPPVVSGQLEAMLAAGQARVDDYKRVLDVGNTGGIVSVPSGKSAQLIRVGPGTEPEPLTVFAQIAPGLSLPSNPDVFLTVRWGVKNFQAECEVDLQQGTMFTVVADYLEVIAVNGGTASANIKVAASVSYGSRAAHAPPQRTKFGLASHSFGNNPVAPTAVGGIVAVPPYARGVYPMPLVTTAGEYAADFVVRQLDRNGNTETEHPYIFSGAPYLSATRLMLTNDTAFLAIENVDAANTINMKWLFDLAL